MDCQSSCERERKEDNDGMQGDKEEMRAGKSTFPIHSFCDTTHLPMRCGGLVVACMWGATMAAAV